MVHGMVPTSVLTWKGFILEVTPHLILKYEYKFACLEGRGNRLNKSLYVGESLVNFETCFVWKWGEQGCRSDSYKEAKPRPHKALCTRKKCLDFILKHEGPLQKMAYTKVFILAGGPAKPTA